MGNQASVQQIVDSASQSTYYRLDNYPVAQLCLVRAKCGDDEGCYDEFTEEFFDAVRQRHTRESGLQPKFVAPTLQQRDAVRKLILTQACDPSAVTPEVKQEANEAVIAAADATNKIATATDADDVKVARGQLAAARMRINDAGKNMVWQCRNGACTAVARTPVAKNCTRVVCKTKTGRRTSCKRRSAMTGQKQAVACKGAAKAVRKASFPYKTPEGRAYRRVAKKDGTFRRVYDPASK